MTLYRHGRQSRTSPDIRQRRRKHGVLLETKGGEKAHPPSLCKSMQQICLGTCKKLQAQAQRHNRNGIHTHKYVSSDF